MGEDERKGMDYSRTLGVIEALTAVKEQCPSKPVRDCAEQALETVKRDGSDALREQVSFVLTMMSGWRGERAAQVHRSLNEFIAGASSADADRSGGATHNGEGGPHEDGRSESGGSGGT